MCCWWRASALLCLRAGYIEFSGQNCGRMTGTRSIPWARGGISTCLGRCVLAELCSRVFWSSALKRSARSWALGKGLVPPIIVIGVVLGSIYGGITGITEAAGMGALAVFFIAVLLHYTTQEWIDLVRSRAARIA